MKNKHHFGRNLTRSELRTILGGSFPGGGGGGGSTCGMVCNNCAALSLNCSSNPDAFCRCEGQGCRCCHYDWMPGWEIFCGSLHACPAGNYC